MSSRPASAPGSARTLLAPLLLLAGLGAGASALPAQEAPRVIHACYVPLTGTVYRIKEADVRQTCSSTSHIEFSWTDGVNALRTGDAAAGDLASSYPAPTVVGLQGRAVSSTAPSSGQVLTFDGTRWAPAAPAAGGGGVTDHGSLSGLADDDHPQYLLTDGVRNATHGFAVTGAINTGSIPTSGAGVRLMWYPRKAAFRAGRVMDDQWDDANIGFRSVAMGLNTTASGSSSTAMGYSTTASGERSTVLGSNTTASGFASTAMGFSTTASGTASTALGENTTASGFASTAMGVNTTASGFASTAMGRSASTNRQAGSFVYGDASTSSTVAATAAHQFLVRASGGFRFRTSANLSTGCDLPAGSGTFNCTSSRWAKEDFAELEGESVLERIARLPIQTWRYKTEPGARHLGPTAQDFHAAFGLGADEETISLVDADGVNLLAVKALEKRTTEQGREIDSLRAENAALRSHLAGQRTRNQDLSQRLERVEALLERMRQR